VLERSTILQQLEEYELSSRDFEAADKQVEMLDFEHGTADDIGRYLYSDDTGPYRAPAYEKVLINTLNMTNYLVRKDLSGARVEARRLAVMQKFLSEHEQTDHAWVGPGSYLAGFVFEQSGSFDEALTFYEEAAAHGLPRELAPQVIRLADRIGKKSSVIEELRKSVPAAPASEGSGELLVVVSYGRVPAKIARRIPIGLALTLVANDISPSNRARANELAAQGLVTWINYPEFPETQARARNRRGDHRQGPAGKHHGRLQHRLLRRGIVAAGQGRHDRLRHHAPHRTHGRRPRRGLRGEEGHRQLAPRHPL
jgi:hypothetical protein